MAILTFGLQTVEIGATAWRVIMNANFTALDPNRFSTGLQSARPAAGSNGRFYAGTDSFVIAFDNGVSWLEFCKVKADSADTTAGYLSDKIENSIVLDAVNHKIQLSGDLSSPGNDKFYGTHPTTGVRGWYPGSVFNNVTVSGNLSVSGSLAVGGNVTLSGLTVQRIPYKSAAGPLADAPMTSDGINVAIGGQFSVLGATVAAAGSININATDSALRFFTTGGVANLRKFEIRQSSYGADDTFCYLQFRTINDDSSVFTTKMTLYHDGGLHINPTAPAYDSAYGLRIGSGAIGMSNNTGLRAMTFGGVYANIFNVNTDDSISFGASSSWSALRFFPGAAEAMRIYPAGHVAVSGSLGIGGYPTCKLSLFGSPGNVDFAVQDTTTGATATDGYQIQMRSTNSMIYHWIFENYGMQFATNNLARMTIAADGNVGIGTATPSQLLTVSGGNFYAQAKIMVSGTAAYAGATCETSYTLQLPNDAALKAKANAWDTYTSSVEWKKDMVNIPDPITKVNSLNGILFEHNRPGQAIHKKQAIGISVEDMEKLKLPGLVTRNEKGEYIGQNLTLLVPILVEALKEVNGRLAKLEKKVDKKIKGV